MYNIVRCIFTASLAFNLLNRLRENVFSLIRKEQDQKQRYSSALIPPEVESVEQKQSQKQIITFNN